MAIPSIRKDIQGRNSMQHVDALDVVHFQVTQLPLKATMSMAKETKANKENPTELFASIRLLKCEPCMHRLGTTADPLKERDFWTIVNGTNTLLHDYGYTVVNQGLGVNGWPNPHGSFTTFELNPPASKASSWPSFLMMYPIKVIES